MSELSQSYRERAKSEAESLLDRLVELAHGDDGPTALGAIKEINKLAGIDQAPMVASIDVDGGIHIHIPVYPAVEDEDESEVTYVAPSGEPVAIMDAGRQAEAGVVQERSGGEKEGISVECVPNEGDA